MMRRLLSESQFGQLSGPKLSPICRGLDLENAGEDGPDLFFHFRMNIARSALKNNQPAAVDIPPAMGGE